MDLRDEIGYSFEETGEELDTVLIEELQMGEEDFKDVPTQEPEHVGLPVTPGVVYKGETGKRFCYHSGHFYILLDHGENMAKGSKSREQAKDAWSFEKYTKEKVRNQKINRDIDITANTHAYVIACSKRFIHPLQRELGIFISLTVAQWAHPKWYQWTMFIIVRLVGRIPFVGPFIASGIAIVSSLPLHYLGKAIHFGGKKVAKMGLKFDIEPKGHSKCHVKAYKAKSFSLGWKLVAERTVKV